MNNKLFQLSDQQKEQIFEAITKYISKIENPDVKQKYINQINNEDFKKKLISGFAEINFLSQTIIVSLKKILDYNVVYKTILEESKNDIFEVQELKTYIINNLIDERYPRQMIDSSLNEHQIKQYRSKMANFKKDYLNLFI